MALDILKVLVAHSPQSEIERDNNGYLSIHEAAEAAQSPEFFQVLIDTYPESLGIIDPVNTLLSLHSACGQHNSNLKTVRLLFDSYLEAIFIDDGRGRTPLDNAQRYGHEYVATFLENQHAFATTARDTTAIYTPDYNDWLPLHHALCDNASLGSIKLLVS